MKAYVLITKIQDLEDHSFSLCVCALSYIYGHSYFIGTLFPLCSFTDYFKATLRISNIIPFHWRHFKETSSTFPGTQCFFETPAGKKANSHCLTTHDEDSGSCIAKLTFQSERPNLFLECTRICLHLIQTGSFELIKGPGSAGQLETME